MDKAKLRERLGRAKLRAEDWTDALLRWLADQSWSWIVAALLLAGLVWCVVRH